MEKIRRNFLIIFTTSNQGKFEEAKAFIPELQQLKVPLPEIQETDAKKILTAKIKEAFKYSQERLVVEDTSLYLECLKGLPGPLIKWFLQTLGTKGLAEIAEKLGNRKARAVTVLGYADNPANISFLKAGSAEKWFKIGEVAALVGTLSFCRKAVIKPSPKWARKRRTKSA